MSNKKTFESNLQRINEISVLLQSGQISLDESVRLYKEACELTEKCRKMLNEAELKIIELNQNYKITDQEDV